MCKTSQIALFFVVFNRRINNSETLKCTKPKSAFHVQYTSDVDISLITVLICNAMFDFFIGRITQFKGISSLKTMAQCSF